MRYLVAFLFVTVALAAGCSDTPREAESDGSDSLVAPVPLQSAAATASLDCDEILGVEVDLVDCDNSQGSEIHVSGSVTWDGLSVHLVSSNSRNRPPHVRDDVLATWDLIPAGEIVFDKEPVRGGVGGNPHFWSVLVDAEGNWISEPVYLGRCVQGKK